MKLRNDLGNCFISVESTPEALAELMSKVWQKEVKPEQIMVEYYGCDNRHGGDGTYKVFVDDEFVAFSDGGLKDA